MLGATVLMVGVVVVWKTKKLDMVIRIDRNGCLYLWFGRWLCLRYHHYNKTSFLYIVFIQLVCII